MTRPRTPVQSPWTYMCVAVLVAGVVAGVLVSSYAVIFTFAGLGLVYFIYLASMTEDVHVEDRSRYPSVTPEPTPKPDPDTPLKAPARARRVRAKPAEPAAPAPVLAELSRTAVEAPTTKKRKKRRRFFRSRKRNPDGSTKGLVPRLRSWRWRRKNVLSDQDVN